jgi:hypothetical protein
VFLVRLPSWAAHALIFHRIFRVSGCRLAACLQNLSCRQRVKPGRLTHIARRPSRPISNGPSVESEISQGGGEIREREFLGSRCRLLARRAQARAHLEGNDFLIWSSKPKCVLAPRGPPRLCESRSLRETEGRHRSFCDSGRALAATCDEWSAHAGPTSKTSRSRSFHLAAFLLSRARAHR